MIVGMFDDTPLGIRLPHPPLSLRSHLIIETAICAAWELMLTHPRTGFDLLAANEDTVTHELFERLYDEVFDKGVVGGFGREVFASVRREPKVRNFNGSSLDKMPDLLVEFIDRPAGSMNSQHGLFIECKPVDQEHRAGSAYCDKGLIRFVRGDYARAMQSAMMVGYARIGYSVVQSSRRLLRPIANKRSRPPSDRSPARVSGLRLVQSRSQFPSTSVHSDTSRMTRQRESLSSVTCGSDVDGRYHWPHHYRTLVAQSYSLSFATISTDEVYRDKVRPPTAFANLIRALVCPGAGMILLVRVRTKGIAR